MLKGSQEQEQTVADTSGAPNLLFCFSCISCWLVLDESLPNVCVVLEFARLPTQMCINNFTVPVRGRQSALPSPPLPRFVSINHSLLKLIPTREST